MTEPTKLTDAQIAEMNAHAKQKREAQEKMGKGQDGTYILIETNLETGEQTVVCHPLDNSQVMRFVHPGMCREWGKEWGEQGYGYAIFKAEEGFMGALSKEALDAKRKEMEEVAKINTGLPAGAEGSGLPDAEMKDVAVEAGMFPMEEIQTLEEVYANEADGVPLEETTQADQAIEEAAENTPVQGITRDVVVSSNIHSVGYDFDRKILEVAFHNGSVYQYRNVPINIYQDLMSSSSIGGYFNLHVKKVYQHQKVG